MQFFEGIPTAFLLILALIVLIWLVLVFLVPFMVEGIRSSSRKTCDELQQMNDKLDRIAKLLANQAAVSRTNAAATTAPPRSEVGPSERRPTPVQTPASGQRPGPAKSASDRKAAASRYPEQPPARREPTISDTPTPPRTRREPRL